MSAWNGGRPAGPVWIRLAARLLVPADRREFVTGDLLELHHRRVRGGGPLRATLRTIRDLIGSAVARGGRNLSPPPLRGGGSFIDDLRQDVRAAFRSVVREPGFTLVTVVTLALGVGSATAVFGIENRLVLRPLPGVVDPAGAAYLNFRVRDDPDRTDGQGITTVDVDALREGLDGAVGLASYGNTSWPVARGSERPLSADVRTVYGDFFEVLGARPAEGRLLRAADTDFSADARVAVLSESFRDRLFAPGEEVVGTTLLMNGQPVRVVGVVRAFRGTERGDDIDVWAPFHALAAVGGFDEARLLDRNSVMHDDFVLRLRAGVTAEEAEARIDAVLAGVGAEHPEQLDYLTGLSPALFPALTTPPMWRAPTR
ncbi:MAG: ABC transporter permease, partial [Phycisphaerales bacterium]|nr:ABC transporter permease [Phycisphaerales bacterium]